MAASSLKKRPAERLDEARPALAAVEGQIAKLRADRARALVDGSSDEAVAKIDAAIAAQERTAGIHRDRIAALEAEAQEALRQQQLVEQAALRDRVSALLDKRMEAGRQLAASIEQAVKSWRDLAATSLAIYESWPWPQDSGGSALGHTDLARMVITETWRTGGTPPTTGAPVAPKGTPPSYPGARAPGLLSVHSPETLPSLVAELEAANRSAKEILTGKRRDVAPPAAATTPGSRMATLLAEMDKLSTDSSPEGEARYRAVVAEITTLNQSNLNG